MKIVDMHCDTVTRLYFDDEGDTKLAKNECHLDLEKMKMGDYLLQNFAVFLNMTKHDDLTDLTLKIIDFFKNELEANKDVIKQVYKYEDIDAGMLNALLTIEDSELVPYEELERFYDLGVRMITLTWNYPNRVGYPNIDGYNAKSYEDIMRIDDESGLTDYGVRYVKKMEELGIIVDVSHASDKLIKDVLAVTTKPFVASHSNARACCNVARNLPDYLIEEMMARDCVIGLNFLGDFLTDDRSNESRIADMIRHLSHFKEIGAIDNIGLGSDFDGINGKLEVFDGRAMKDLVAAMEKVFSKEEVEKITHGNVLNLYKEMLQ